MRRPLRLVAAQTGSDDGGDDIYTQILRRFSPQLFLSLFASILAASALQPASAQALRSIDGQHPVDAFALSLDGGMLGISHTEKRSRSPWASASGRAFLGAAQERADVPSSGTLNGSNASMTTCSRTCYWSEAVI